MTSNTLLIEGGRVYQHQGNTDSPSIADVFIRNGSIERVGSRAIPGAQPPGEPDRIINARDRLLIPGLVNAHYHSHDVLLKGSYETIPFYVWLLNALPPQYPKRSVEEVRARTLLGAAECLHNGITTVQDMLTISPFDEEHLDAVLDAYDSIGIRAVFSLQVGDTPGIERVPFWRETVPERFHSYLGAAVAVGGPSPAEMVREQYLRQVDAGPRLTWALSPTSAILSSRELLEEVAALSSEYSLPVTTHLYETRPEAVGARRFLGDYGGSQVRYLESVGLLGPRLAVAHGVWLTHEEIIMLADTNTNVVVNPASNLKTKSGVAPIREYLSAGVSMGLGCDNCSCNDAQNMFQSMKLLCGLGAISDPEPGPPTAADALRIATEGSAGALGLGGQVGALEPGMKADISLLDLTSVSFVPLNSAARQTVFSESGAGVHTVVVDGQVVMEDRKLICIDEDDLRTSVEIVMRTLGADQAEVRARIESIYPYLLDAWRRAWQEEVGVHRYVGPPRTG